MHKSILWIILLAFLWTPAQATISCNDRGCVTSVTRSVTQVTKSFHKQTIYKSRYSPKHQHIYKSRQPHTPGGSGPSEILSHPSGCPRSAFCGCGAAVYLFGEPRRSLWLAANWFKFPRAEPGPQMAAVRQHHVMVIIEYLGNGMAKVYDANSGHGQTRIHVRSLAGYRIVNPHG